MLRASSAGPSTDPSHVPHPRAGSSLCTWDSRVRAPASETLSHMWTKERAQPPPPPSSALPPSPSSGRCSRPGPRGACGRISRRNRSWPPEVRTISFCCVESPSLWHFVTQPQDPRRWLEGGTQGWVSGTCDQGKGPPRSTWQGVGDEETWGVGRRASAGASQAGPGPLHRPAPSAKAASRLRLCLASLPPLVPPPPCGMPPLLPSFSVPWVLGGH